MSRAIAVVGVGLRAFREQTRLYVYIRLDYNIARPLKINTITNN